MKTHIECRANGGALRTILNLGMLHLSAFLAPGQPDPPAYPLEVAVGENSGLVQLRHTVDQDALYRNYWYRSGTNEAMREHLQGIARYACELTDGMLPESVLDIGCNDGTLMTSFRSILGDDSTLIGFDPSDIRPNDRALHDFIYVNSYFDPDHALLHSDSFDLVTTIAMFYDIETPVKFANDIRKILADGGIWIIEMHYLHDMLDKVGFDAICHEHLTYYSLQSLEYVLAQAGLYVFDVQRNAVNGGSFRVAITKDLSIRPARPSVSRMRAYEQAFPPDFDLFAKRIEANRRQVCEIIASSNAVGNVWGYGASTKGSTLAQYYGLSPTEVIAIAERNPRKVGLVTSGTRIPIVSESEMREHIGVTDTLLVFPYHFIDGFRARESAFLKAGGRFLVPVPQPHFVGE